MMNKTSTAAKISKNNQFKYYLFGYLNAFKFLIQDYEFEYSKYMFDTYEEALTYLKKEFHNVTVKFKELREDLDYHWIILPSLKCGRFSNRQWLTNIGRTFS